MKKVLFSTLALLSLLSSCKKDDKKKGATSATAKTIADKRWQLTAHTFNYMGKDYDGYTMLADCDKDNLMIFRSDYANELDQGATKCDPSVPQTQIEGKWEMRSGDTEIYRSGISSGSVVGLSDMTFTILEVSETTLKLKYTTTVSGPAIENVATYTAK